MDDPVAVEREVLGLVREDIDTMVAQPGVLAPNVRVLSAELHGQFPQTSVIVKFAVGDAPAQSFSKAIWRHEESGHIVENTDLLPEIQTLLAELQ